MNAGAEEEEEERDGRPDESDAHLKGHDSSAATPPKGAASATRLPSCLSPPSSVARFILRSIWASASLLPPLRRVLFITPVWETSHPENPVFHNHHLTSDTLARQPPMHSQHANPLP